MQVMIVLGTRPEAIKMVPVYLALRDSPEVQVRLLVTSQHREMLDQVMDVFNIVPDIDLDIMRPNQDLGQVSSQVILGVQDVLQKTRCDAVLVHGDTTTCLCSTLAAFYEQIPVGHVEAGLRTYDFSAPWPEEMNRRLTDPICRWCFAPTARAAANLRAEQIPEENIFVTGNTVIDALFLAQKLVRDRELQMAEIPQEILDNHKLILVTGHRRESFGKPFQQFCQALRQIVQEHSDTVLVYPVHLNPNVQEPVNQILGGQERIYLTQPVEYLRFVYLMDRSYLIITDSGGIQEEANALGKPVLVTRNVTERPEAIEAGCAKLVGTSKDNIVREASLLLTDRQEYERINQNKTLFGDGHASERIVDILCSSMH